MATGGGDLIKVTSNSSSTGALTLINTPVDAKHRAFTASLNGKIISYRIDHATIDTQFEVVEGVYTHGSLLLTRPAASVVHGTAGAGANTDFSVGGLIVTVVPQWQDLIDARGKARGPVITSTHNAAAFDILLTNTSGGSFSVNLPVGEQGVWVELHDLARDWAQNPITLVPQGGATILLANGTTAATLDLDGGGYARLYYDLANTRWYPSVVSGPDADEGTYREPEISAPIAAGVVTLDLTLGNHFDTSMTAAITSVVLSNATPVAGYTRPFAWLLRADGTIRSLALPSGWLAMGSPAPTEVAANKSLLITGIVRSNGTVRAMFAPEV